MKDIDAEGLSALNGALPFLLADYLEEVPPENEEEINQVLDIVRGKFLDKNFETNWKEVRVELVKNKHLETEYDEKKQDLLIRGRQPEELREEYAFVIENNVATLETVTAVGLQTHESDYNPIGYARLGIYLCKHSDICMQHALIKHSATQVLRLMVFKYLTGRQTTAIPRTATASEFIEPTQGYDSHVSALPPFLSDPLQTQYDRSQVFLYEINKLLQPSTRPRQATPYAVVTFTENGQYVPAIDAKATPKEKLAGNPRLQEIIKAINAKNDPASAQKNGTGLLQSPSLPGSVGPASPGSKPAAPGQSPVMPTAATASGIPLHLNGTSKVINGATAGLLNGHNLALKTALSRSQGMGGSPLNMIISQINARLDGEGKPKMSPTSTVSPGDGILGSPPAAAVSGIPTSMASNGSAGSSSPLSRPGSTESMLSGITPVNTQPKSTLLPSSGSLAPQRYNVMGDGHLSLKGAAAAASGIPTMMPGLAPMLNLNLAPQAAQMFSRKAEPTLLDYGHGHSNLLTTGHIQNLYPAATFQGHPFYVGDRLQGSALPLQSTYQTLASSLSHPIITTAQLPQTTLLRPAIKRAFPDTSAGLEWDKRPKFY